MPVRFLSSPDPHNVAIDQHSLAAHHCTGRTRWGRRAATAAVLVVLVLTGCETAEQKLDLEDLGADERLFVERMVLLERAKAVALADPELGTALLDSIAAAWGDSILPQTESLAPRDPARSAAVADLLMRVLAAEDDSLLHAPRPDRLLAPLPEPATPEEPVQPDQ